MIKAAAGQDERRTGNEKQSWEEKPVPTFLSLLSLFVSLSPWLCVYGCDIILNPSTLLCIYISILPVGPNHFELLSLSLPSRH